jgi:hypothetical protein
VMCVDLVKWMVGCVSSRSWIYSLEEDLRDDLEVGLIRTIHKSIGGDVLVDIIHVS